MQKWEYRHVGDESFTRLTDKLNKLGDEGWELVALIAESPTASSGYLAVLKRPKK